MKLVHLVAKDIKSKSFMHNCGMYILLSDDKHQMVRDSSKKCTGQHGHNSSPVATLPHAAVVFRMQPFNIVLFTTALDKFIVVTTARPDMGQWAPISKSVFQFLESSLQMRKRSFGNFS